METRQLRLTNIIQQSLSPFFFQLENESHLHGGQQIDSHFKILVVSEKFRGISKIDRQRLVNDLLQIEFKSGLHALTQRLYSPEEWETEKNRIAFTSPDCHGGSKKKT